MNVSKEVGNYKIPPDCIRDMQDAEVFLRWHDFDKAEFCFNHILQKYPKMGLMYHNLAATREMTGRGGAEALYRKAIEVSPDDPYMHHFFALWLLSNGKLEEGWKEYEWRTKRAANSIPFMAARLNLPYWNGEDLKGKKVVLWSEQGIGDEVLMATMIPDLIKTGATILFVASVRMYTIFRKAFPTITVIARGELFGASQYDYQVSVVELGKFLRPNMDSFPVNEPFLKVNPENVWSPNPSGKLKVGISWRSTNAQSGEDKSVPLYLWKRVLQQPNIDFVCLQHGNHYDELEKVIDEVGANVYVPADGKDVPELLNVIAGLDLVISVSNTNVHLAGGLGVPVWNIVPDGRGRIWYWFKDKETSPWYPSMRMFRWADGNQAATMDTIAKHLDEFHYMKKGQD